MSFTQGSSAPRVFRVTEVLARWLDASTVKEPSALHDDGVAFYKDVGFADGQGRRGVVAFGGAQGKDQDLVFPVVNKRIQVGNHLGTFFVGELALEDGVLQVLAISVHFFKNAPKAFVVGDIVCHEIDVSHGSPRKEVWQAGNLAGQRAGEKPGLDFENTAVRDTVIENRVGDEIVHPFFVGKDEFCAFR